MNQLGYNVAMNSVYQNISSQLSLIATEEDKLPKYRKLSEAILALIEADVLKPGDQLPTESGLTDQLPFSLGTVQKALRNLSELGVIERTRRRGSVISERTSQIHDLWQFRFVDEDKGSVYPVFSKVLDMEVSEHSGPWRDFLGSNDAYLCIDREIDINHQFQVYSSFYLSANRFSEMAEMQPSELEGVHLSAVIQRKYGITTIRTKNQLICSVIPDPVCLKLGIPSGARGLICDILGFGNDKKPLTFQRVYVPADAPPMEFNELKPT